MFDYLALKRADRRMSVAAGFADQRDNVKLDNAREREIVSRLVRAFQLAQADMKDAPAQFQIKGLWRDWLDLNYEPLISAMTSGDFDSASRILRNFSREQFTVGTGASYDDCVQFKTSLVGRAYIKTVWCRYRDHLANEDFDLSTLTHPRQGNPGGLTLNGMVVPIETFRHAHNAFSSVNLLRDVPRPVLVEIGGGMGGQAYQFASQFKAQLNPLGKYFDFDIPEVQIAASYFLLAALPELKVRLYGEGAVSAAPDETFDLGIFPHYTIDRLADRSVDLLFNSCSFSEMDQTSSQYYISAANRVCRKYLMHINHDMRMIFDCPDGTQSRNALGSELLPDARCFKRIYKRPRLFQRPEDAPFKSFAYLYERMSGR